MATPIIPDPVVVVAAKSHPLHSLRRVTLRALTRYRWLLPAGDSMNRLWLTQVFQRAGLPPPEVQIELEFDRLDAAPYRAYATPELHHCATNCLRSGSIRC